VEGKADNVCPTFSPREQTTNQPTENEKLVTIIILVVSSAFAHAEPPKKFKSYVEMQAERAAKADEAYARFAAEQKIKEENALIEAARVVQQKEHPRWQTG
jgi:hypothetical protein